MLTDERIEELCWTELDRRLLSFARAIEAEVTKPCVCGDSSAQGVFHRNDGPCYIAVEEATKPQEPIKLNIVRKWPEGFQDRLQCVWLDVVSFTANVKLYDLQRVLAEFGFAMEIYEGNATPQPCQSCAEKQSAIDVWEGRYADLSAKCAELEDFCISQGNELAKLDEKVFDQDRLLKQQAEKISATLVALAGLPDGALDGGWTYAGMNKYALGLEVKCAELEAERGDLWSSYKELKAKCAELEQDLQTTADALAENEESEKAWEMLDTERVRYLNDVGDVLGQNNTDESLINAAKRVVAERDALKDEIEDIKSHIARTTAAALRKQHDEWRKDRQERDALAITVHQLRDALDNCKAWAGSPDEVYRITKYALALPDTSEIIKRHDAAVLRKAADTTLSEQSVLLDGMHGYTALKIQGLMIESLHLKADELEKS